jgi:ABC-2 type transport system permease protein
MTLQAVSRWRRNVRLYFRLQLMQLRTVVEYRGDFWIGIVGAALDQFGGLLLIWALFQHLSDVKGWSVWQVGILYGLALLPKGLSELFCDGPWSLRVKVNSGEFDRILVRPISPALQTATAIASIHGLGQTGLGAGILLMAMNRAGIDWNPWKVVFLVIVLGCSTVMIGAINYLVNMIGFWEPSAQSAIPTMYARMIDFAKFPLDIYNLVIRVIVTLVAPFAFISYFPALVLMDKDTAWKWLGYASPLATLLVVLLVRWLWGKALNRYQGVGH